MNDHIRERILRKLDGIPDDRAYQVLDYVEFLESKYASKQGTAAGLLTRFSEGVEDTMRAGKVSTAAIAETMGLLNKAVGVLNGVAAAGKSVASDIVSVASRPTASRESAAMPARSTDAGGSGSGSGSGDGGGGGAGEPASRGANGAPTTPATPPAARRASSTRPADGGSGA